MGVIRVTYDPLHCTLVLSSLVLQISLARTHFSCVRYSLVYPCFDPFPWATHGASPFTALEHHIMPVVLLDTFTLIE